MILPQVHLDASGRVQVGGTPPTLVRLATKSFDRTATGDSQATK